MSRFKRGDQVLTMVDMEPYYSGYGRNPKLTIPKGTLGIIGAVDVPCVTQSTTKPHPLTFNCVDFMIDEVKWRGGYYNKQIKRVRSV